MPVNQQLDSLQFNDLAFPYNKLRGELFEDPTRIIRGQNLYITTGGKIARRPGTFLDTVFNRRVDRTWLYETLDSPTVVFLVCSVFNSGTGFWEIWYQRRSQPSLGTFTKVTDFRDSNASTAPHTATPARGFLYIKSYPSGGSAEKLGGFVFDGTAGTVTIKPWGILGPTTPARIVGAVAKTVATLSAVATSFTTTSITGFPVSFPFTAQLDYEQVSVTNITGAGPYTWTITRGFNSTAALPHLASTTVLYRNWSASAHAIQVSAFFQYSYCYKSITGQYSNRAPLENNPDQLPSLTGPFNNLIPKITYIGLADTVNIPKIVILRTTDGGGTWYILDEIANPGSGAQTYEDKTQASNAGNADPISDLTLTTKSFAPSLVSNSPPPTVISPLVTGTDAPAKSTPLAYYQGRQWIMIGNYLFFSADSEINVGVPEESWPSGIGGNFFRFQYPGANLIDTANALYIFTTGQIYALTGNNRETFNVQPLFQNYGMSLDHPRAVTRFAEYVAFLTHDYRVALIKDNQLWIISDSLNNDLIDTIMAGATVDLKYWADTNKQYLLVCAHNVTTPSLSRQFVFDLTRSLGENLNNPRLNYSQLDEFWFTPWTYPAQATVSGRIFEGDTRRRFLFNNFDGTNGSFVQFDASGATTTDIVGSTKTTFDLSGSLNLVTIPPGNHVNKMRAPHLNPVLHYFVIERTSYPGDSDLEVFWYKDDLHTTPLAAPIPHDSESRSPSIGFASRFYQISEALHRVGLEFKKTASAEPVEIQNIIFTFAPESGS